jgi:uncharacterized protein with HEPN domain
MKSDQVYLHHISDATKQIDEYLSGVSFLDFERTKLLQDGIIRQLEIVGEAAGNLSVEIRNKHTEIPWVDVVALRNRLIHAYDRVDLGVVWEIATTDLPILRKTVANILSQ